MDKLKRFEKGNTERTLLHTEEANKVVDTLNALANMEFVPSGSAKIEVAGDKAIITIKGNQAVRGFVEDPDTGELTLGTFQVMGRFAPDAVQEG